MKIQLYSLAIKLTFSFSPSLAGKLVLYLFNRSIQKKTSGINREFYKSGIVEDIRLGAYNVKVYKTGNGPVVLLCHEWGRSSNDFEDLAKDLVAQQYSVIIPDLPYHGKSSGESIDITRMSYVLEDLIIYYSSRKQIDYVVTHGLTSVPFFLAIDRLLNANRKLHLEIKRVITLGAPIDVNSYINHFCNSLHLSSSLVQHLLKDLDKIGENQNEEIAELFTHRLHILMKEHLNLFIIHDEEDHIVPYENGVELNKKVPSSKLLTTRGIGHYEMIGDQQVIGPVLEYLNGT